MAVKTLLYCLCRAIRICADFFTDCIGVFYPSKRNYLPPLTDPLLLQPIVSLIQKIKNGQLKSEDLVKAYINQIKAVNPLINALTDQRFDSAIEEAKQIDRNIAQHLSGDQSISIKTIESMTLLGIPFTIKDCIGVKGMSLTAGLVSQRDKKADSDAEVVQNLREAGAIPICMTNVPEFALNWDTSNKIHGQTNNPYDKSRIPGGSSGGEAALISSAGSVVGIGSDFGGSIRIPAYFCGVFGHKPTVGIIPINGFFPDIGHKEREKYLQIGPICRYASDLSPMLRGCAGKQISSLNLEKELDFNELRVYFMITDGDPLKTPVSGDVLNVIEKVIRFLDTKTKRASQKVFLPLMKHSLATWICSIANVEAPYLSSQLTQSSDEVNGWLELFKGFVGKSNYRLSTALNAILYNILNPNKSRKTQKFQEFVSIGYELKRELTDILGNNGVLLCPTLPETAPKHNGILLKNNYLGYSMIFNITGHPVTQVPLGLTSNGLPVGLQIVTNPFNDHLSIGVAKLLEQEFGGWVPPFNVNLEQNYHDTLQ